MDREEVGSLETSTVSPETLTDFQNVDGFNKTSTDLKRQSGDSVAATQNVDGLSKTSTVST